MSGITGLGTTYNLPNYTGELMAITPADTPLLSAIGGLTGGQQATSVEFEWQFYDLRDASDKRKRLEGQPAPSSELRVRGNVTNICQIHQEKVSVSYTKLAATQQKAGVNNAAANPITTELDWQVSQSLKQMASDVEFSFFHSQYNKPTDNTQTRSTRGLIQAITSNNINAGTVVEDVSAATDTVTSASHGFNDGDKIVFTAVGASDTIVPGRTYFVRDKAAGTFKIASTAGGTAITISTATLSYIKPSTTALTYDKLSDLMQRCYDNGGLTGGVPALISGSTQKRAVTKAIASEFAKAQPVNGNVGGVNVQVVETDFGPLNLMMSRLIPADMLMIASLDQLAPVFLETPGKGHFFAEPLAKTGASDDVQLYGEVGLAYGNEKAHGILRGLPL